MAPVPLESAPYCAATSCSASATSAMALGPVILEVQTHFADVTGGVMERLLAVSTAGIDGVT